jgi:hypothetical protein
MASKKMNKNKEFRAKNFDRHVISILRGDVRGSINIKI